jgi:MFS family permease
LERTGTDRFAPRPSSDPQAPALQSWPLLLVAFTILTVAFSWVFSVPVFYGGFIRKFGWTHAEAVAGGSIVLLLIGLLGPLVGRAADRFSPKAVVLVGLTVSAGALALLSTTTNLAEFLSYCVLLGIGSASVSLVPCSMLIAPWFARSRGLAVGVINSGVGLGGLFAPNLTRAMIERRGASGAFLALAASVSVPFLLTLLLVRRQTPHSTQAAPPSAIAFAKTPIFWMLGVGLFFAAHTLTGVQQSLILYLTGQGVAAAAATLAYSVLLGASAPGKLLGGLLSDRFSARVSLLASILCLVAGITGLLLSDPKAALILVIAGIFGLGYGGVFNAPSIIAFESVGTQGVGTILGLFMMFFGLGTSSGGLLAGAIYDQTHRYAVSFSVDLASCAVGFVLLFAAGWMREFRPAPLAAALRKTA